MFRRFEDFIFDRECGMGMFALLYYDGVWGFCFSYRVLHILQRFSSPQVYSLGFSQAAGRLLVYLPFCVADSEVNCKEQAAKNVMLREC